MQAKPLPVRAAGSFSALRKRVERLFSAVELGKDPRQAQLDFSLDPDWSDQIPTASLHGFIDFLASALPQGQIYLFGGVLRDLALFGRRGFNSDVDIVVEGAWSRLESYLSDIGAHRNKFGGYRLFAGDWPIDIWNAEDTWAIRRGLVRYDGISSLTRTTVLNWDAILMNWRTGAFISEADYLVALNERSLDVVLEDNPNPLGMAVRVFRHLASKDAKRVGSHAIQYLERATEHFSYQELVDAERASYGGTLMEPVAYRLFSLSRGMSGRSERERFLAAAAELENRGDGVAWRQLDLTIQVPQAGSDSLTPSR